MFSGLPVYEFFQYLQRWLPVTVSPLEIIWTVPAILGSLRYWARYFRANRARRRIAISDLASLSERTVADARCLLFLSLAVVLGWFSTAGMITMFLPTGPTTSVYYREAYWVGILIMAGEIWLILLGELLDTFDWLVARYTRLYVEEVERVHGR